MDAVAVRQPTTSLIINAELTASTPDKCSMKKKKKKNAQGVTQSASSTMCTGTQVHCKEDSAATIASTTVLLTPEEAPHGSRRLNARIVAQIERHTLGGVKMTKVD